MKIWLSSCLCWLFLLLVLEPAAQPVPDNKYGEGGTRTTTTTTDNNGTVTVTEEYRNAFMPPKVKERTTRIKNRAGGDSIVISVIFDEFMQGELKESTTESRYNANGDMYYHSAVKHDADGIGVSSGSWSEKQPDGNWTEYKYNPRTKQFERVREGRPKKFRENGITGWLASCDTASWEFIASMSLLFGQPNNDYVGIQAAVAYHLTPRLGLMIDGSLHFKKDLGVNLTKAYLLGGLQYHILSSQGGKKIVPMLRLLAGISRDNEKYSNTSFGTTAFALGGGLNLNLFLSRAVYFSFMSDYILTGFDERLLGRPRISGGIRIRAGCK